MRYKIIIPGRLPNLNDYTSANRYNRYKGATMKRDAQTQCETYILLDWRGLKITQRVWLHYKWFEKDNRRDMDNVSGFGHKVIQDALVSTGILKDDGWSEIAGYTDEFFVDKKNPRVELEIEEIDGRNR